MFEKIKTWLNNRYLGENPVPPKSMGSTGHYEGLHAPSTQDDEVALTPEFDDLDLEFWGQRHFERQDSYR